MRAPAFRHVLASLAMALLLGMAAPAAADDKPRIVASILPVHSLLTALAGDEYDVELLVPASASPHGYSMRPSEARRLQNADLIVWVGPELETFLERSLQGARHQARVISLMEDLELDLLEPRAGGVWEGHHDHGSHDDHGHEDHHDHGHDHDHGHEDHGHEHATDHAHHDQDGQYDSHLWLSPAVVGAMVDQLAERIIAWDPERRDAIHANRDALLQRIDALDAELAEQLAPVRDQRFIVFHDAYQYFEQHYGLNAAGSISIDPSQMPGARRLSELRERVQEGDVVCLFTEPQFRPALAQTVAEGTDTRLGVLDPVGAQLEPGPDAWFQLMRGMADGFTDCMAPSDS